MHLLKTLMVGATAILLASNGLGQGLSAAPKPEVLPSSTMPQQATVAPAPLPSNVPSPATSTVLLPVGGSDAADPTKPGIDMNNPICFQQAMKYDVTLEAIAFRLSDARYQPLVINQNTNGIVANTESFSFGYEPGVRMIYDYVTEDGPIFEVGYMGVYGWESRLRFIAADTLSLPSTLGTDAGTLSFNRADQMLLRYESRMNSGEVNLLLPEKDMALAPLIGFRFLKVEEEMTINSLDNNQGNGWYEIDTRNDLLGAQVGARWRGCFRRIMLESFTKLGVFSNSARESTFTTIDGYRTVLRNFNTERSATSFMVDFSFTAVYPYNKYLLFRAGYNMMYINALARAPDQFDPSNNTTSGSIINLKGEAFMHGPSAGVEMRW